MTEQRILSPRERTRNTIERLVRQLGPRRCSLVENVLMFGAILRLRKIDVTTGRTLDALESLTYIDVFNREDFYQALRTNLVSNQADTEKFDRVFEEYWIPLEVADGVAPGESEGFDPRKNEQEGEGDGENEKSADQQIEIESFLDESEADDGGEEEEDTPGYSAEEVLRAKDFSNYTDEDVTRVRKLIAKIAPKIATKLSRRTKPDRDGPIVDLRRSMRSSLKYGGDILELARRERKRKKLKLVMVCDVSGSMDVYSRFLIQFIYGLQQEIKNVETFVFSTRLSRITELFKRKELTQALSAMSEQVADWSGGTSIGGALREFNEGPGKGLVDGRTVVMVISDGWDRGDPAVLEHEIAQISRRCYRLIWLNPLLGSPNYQPLCKGMQAALPFTDYFLPAHNLDSLSDLARTLETISAA